MFENFLTVEATAEELHLHPKTVLRFIREGRLRASKVGKQYRILRADLRKFAGVAVHGDVMPARATSVVDIEDVDHVLLQRLTAVLLGAGKRTEQSGESVSVEIAHDPVRRSVKVIAFGSPRELSTLLALVDTCLES